MSSPVQNDFDEHGMYQPRWGREPGQDLSEAVLAAAERLKRQQQQRAAATRAEPMQGPPKQNPRPASIPRDPCMAAAAPRSHSDIEEAMSEIVRENWSPQALGPVVMPPPPRQGFVGPSWGMVFRVCGAVACAATVAMFVAGGTPLSSIGPLSGADKSAAVPAVAVASADPADLRAVTPTPSEQRVVAASPSFAPNAVIGVAVASTPPPQAQPQPELPQAITTPRIAPSPPPGQPALSRDEIAALVARGQELVSQGDIAGGRLLLRRAAEAGDVQAAEALGGTYDSAVLARLKVFGVAPDDARARAWYEKAAAGGAVEASHRLDRLATGRTQ